MPTDLVAPRATGFAGSALVAVGGFGAGALPVGVPFFAGAVVVTAAAATALVTAIAGTGYGWIGALDTPITPRNWSLTGLLGRWTADLVAPDAAVVVNLWRWVGVLATLVVALLVS